VDITSGPDGALWFVELRGNKVGRLTVGGALTEYAVPTSDAQPAGIVFAPPGFLCLDAHLWFTERAGNKLGRIRAVTVP
jgi:virginiamycin B lyase